MEAIVQKAGAELRPGVSFVWPSRISRVTQEFESFLAAIVYLKLFWAIHLSYRWLFEGTDFAILVVLWWVVTNRPTRHSYCLFARDSEFRFIWLRDFFGACFQISIICGGSYRRGKAESSDMDFVMTHPDGHRLFFMYLLLSPCMLYGLMRSSKLFIWYEPSNSLDLIHSYGVILLTSSTIINWLTADITFVVQSFGFPDWANQEIKRRRRFNRGSKACYRSQHWGIGTRLSSTLIVPVMMWFMFLYYPSPQRIKKSRWVLTPRILVAYFRGRIMELILILDFASTQAVSNAIVLTSRFVFCLFINPLGDFHIQGYRNLIWIRFTTSWPGFSAWKVLR